VVNYDDESTGHFFLELNEVKLTLMKKFYSILGNLDNLST